MVERGHHDTTMNVTKEEITISLNRGSQSVTNNSIMMVTKPRGGHNMKSYSKFLRTRPRPNQWKWSKKKQPI